MLSIELRSSEGTCTRLAPACSRVLPLKPHQPSAAGTRGEGLIGRCGRPISARHWLLAPRLRRCERSRFGRVLLTLPHVLSECARLSLDGSLGLAQAGTAVTTSDELEPARQTASPPNQTPPAATRSPSSWVSERRGGPPPAILKRK